MADRLLVQGAAQVAQAEGVGKLAAAGAANLPTPSACAT